MYDLRTVRNMVTLGGVLTLFSPQLTWSEELPASSFFRPDHLPATPNNGIRSTSVFPSSVVHADPAMKYEGPATASADSRSDRYARLASLWDRVKVLAQMPDGWAGDGSIPPSQAVISYTSHLLTDLPEDLQFPQATASGEGEIGLTWFNVDDRLDAIISPDGHLTWVSKVEGEYFEGAELDLSKNPFDPLYESLTKFYG